MADRRALAAFTALSLIWGSTWLFIKIGLGYEAPIAFLAARLLLGALALLPFVPRQVRPEAHELRAVVLFGLLETAGMLLVFLGEVDIPSSRAAILAASSPLFVLLLAAPLLGERLTLPRVVGTLVGLLGVVLAAASLHGRGFAHTPAARLAGELILLGAAFLYALATVMGKRLIVHTPPTLTAALQMAVGGVILVPLALLVEGPRGVLPHPLAGAFVFALLYLATVGSALAFFLYFFLMTRVSGLMLSFINIANTVLSVVLGGLVLHEPLTPYTAAGALLVLLAVWLVQAVPAAARASPPPGGDALGRDA